MRRAGGEAASCNAPAARALPGGPQALRQTFSICSRGLPLVSGT